MSSTRRARALAIGCALVAVLAAPALAQPGTPLVVSAGSGPSSNEPGFEQLGECLSTADRVEALYVMDVSGSLQATDPSGDRFTALEASVIELGNAGATAGDRLTVHAAVAYFGNGYTSPSGVGNWTALNSADAGEVASGFRQQAESVWTKTQPLAEGTNYAAALSGGRTSLGERGTARGTCRVMFWFTDGLFDVGPGTDSVSDQMCAPGGLVDQVRTDGISIFALSLFNKTVRDQLRQPVNAPRRGELQAIAVGLSQQQVCGTDPVPEGSRAGVYLTVGESADLASLFSAALAQGRGGARASLPPVNPVQVPVDQGISAFQLDVTLGKSVDQVVVSPPGSARVAVPLDGSEIDAGTAALTGRKYGTFVTLTASLGDPPDTGEWTIDVVSPVRSAAVYYFSGLRATIAPPKGGVRPGEATQVPIALTRVDGSPADLTVYGSVSATGTVGRASGATKSVPVSVTDAAEGRLAASVTAPADLAQVPLSVSVNLKTRSGLELAPVNSNRLLPTVLPGAFPRIAPSDVLVAGVVSGVDPVRSELTLIGSSEGPSEVCLAPAQDIDYPSRAEEVTVDYKSGCVALATDEVQAVAVEVATDVAADGPGSAIISVTLISAKLEGRPSQSVEALLPVTWDMTRPVNQAKRLWLDLLLIALAAAIPLAVLSIINQRLARFDAGEDSRAGAFSVVVDQSGIRASESGRLIRSESLRFKFIDTAKQVLMDEWHDRAILVAQAPKSPFTGPKFRAVSSAGTRIVASDATVRDSGRSAPVSAGLGTVMLVSFDEAQLTDTDGPVAGQLLVIVRESGEPYLRELEAQLHAVDWFPALETLKTIVSEESGPRSEGDVEAGLTPDFFPPPGRSPSIPPDSIPDDPF